MASLIHDVKQHWRDRATQARHCVKVDDALIQRYDADTVGDREEFAAEAR